ncbi:MAG: class I SAM-dependent methyltransferase [Candidatus Eisenbacteria bacterium]|uniref:Class I SAM-dependent methyltransferase n=1 Tax=Eiseniibacteriota bacterium TaxID=2212470 RepID=A0A849SNU3_UNCEI|nr:class I SAM-dependent methyltransferase [Candidatus Eisenbacteria bacterium]
MNLPAALARVLAAALRHPGRSLRHALDLAADLEGRRRAAALGFARGFPSVELTTLTGPLDLTIDPFTFLDGTSRVTDLALLVGLARRLPNAEYLEIGSWRGESLVNVARHAASAVSVSLSEAEMRALGLESQYLGMDGMFLDRVTNVTRVRQDSTTLDFESLGRRFDLIFVDGDHHHDAVVSDTRNAFRMLRDDRSVIVWHDCGNSYEDFRWEVVSSVLAGTPPELRHQLYRVSHSLCGVFTRAPIESGFPSFPAEPRELFDVTIRSRPFARG